MNEVAPKYDKAVYIQESEARLLDLKDRLQAVKERAQASIESQDPEAAERLQKLIAQSDRTLMFVEERISRFKEQAAKQSDAADETWDEITKSLDEAWEEISQSFKKFVAFFE